MKQYTVFLESKKYNSEEKKLFLIGIVQNLIYSTDIFPSNSSLNEYIKVFEKTFMLNDDELFKDYLYKSRPLLSSRVCKLIILNVDPNIDRELINWHVNFLNNFYNLNTEQKHRNNKNQSLLNDFLAERNKHK